MNNPQEDFFDKIDAVVLPQINRAFKGGLEQGIATTLTVLFETGMITEEQAESVKDKLLEKHREALPSVFEKAKRLTRQEVRAELN